MEQGCSFTYSTSGIPPGSLPKEGFVDIPNKFWKRWVEKEHLDRVDYLKGITKHLRGMFEVHHQLCGPIKEVDMDWIDAQELNSYFEDLESYLSTRERHDVKECKECVKWYKDTIEITKKIKDKKVREALLRVWETLWLNNCGDFDIIAIELTERMNEP